MRHVQQKDEYTCGVAVVAMVTGRSFEEVLATHQELHKFSGTGGMSSEELDEMLDHYKMEYVRQVYPTLLMDCTYIVTVPSLNRRGGNHFVVVRTPSCTDEGVFKFEVLDPQYGRADSYQEFKLESWSEAVRILDAVQ